MQAYCWTTLAHDERKFRVENVADLLAICIDSSTVTSQNCKRKTAFSVGLITNWPSPTYHEISQVGYRPVLSNVLPWPTPKQTALTKSTAWVKTDKSGRSVPWITPAHVSFWHDTNNLWISLPLEAAQLTCSILQKYFQLWGSKNVNEWCINAFPADTEIIKRVSMKYMQVYTCVRIALVLPDILLCSFF